MSGTRPRTVVFCIDGLSFEYLDRFDLPNFSRLRNRGVETPLESTFPPWTGSAWPSMYTGSDPSYHGVFDFFRYDRYPDEFELVTRNDVKAPALWNYLTARDVPSAVLNMPVTHPAEPIEGTMIPGYLAPETADGYPDGIREELAAELGEYRIYSRAELGERDDYSVSDYVDLIDLRRRAARHLLETRPWQLAVVQVQKTDAVFHNFDDERAFARVYRAADELVGTVTEMVDDHTNVVVCSDHGIGPTRGYRIYLNQILEGAGYVEAAENTGTTPQLKTKKARLTGTDADEADAEENERRSLATGAVSFAQSAFDRVGITPADLASVADRTGVTPFFARHFSDAIRDSLERSVDWRASTAYCRSPNELGVRINLEGREPAGTVSSDEYETIRDDLIALLSGLETPDGRPAFEAVRRREAVYVGPFAGDACDVLVTPTDMENTLATNLLGPEFVSIDDYDHKRSGVFIGAGPGFDASSNVKTLSLTAVAPAVMTLLDCPVPERMTGSTPDEILTVTPTSADYGDLAYATGTETPGVNDEVESRLGDLGYL